MARSTLFAALAICALAACRTVTPAPSPDVPRLIGNQYGYDIERYKGQMVRVCGRVVDTQFGVAVEYVPRPGDFFFHGSPAVLIVPCGSARPSPDADNCILGRVAARDGSVTPPPRTSTDDRPVDRDWFLHPQCPARRR